MDGILIQDQIEGDLIHFTHARKLKKSETAPDTHRAKQIQESLDIFTSEKTKNIQACYKKLVRLHASWVKFSMVVGPP